MYEMGSHDPFGHLKQKLWSKEGPGVKLTVWLPTTKSHESTRFPCVKVAFHILLESSWWGLHLCFRPHINQRSAEDVMGPQSCESPKFENFEFTHLGVLGQNAIWMWPSWRGTEYTIKGKVVVSPKFGPWWILWVWICLWLILAPKVFKLCTNQLVV
jgi:hypothetical protein